MEIVFVPTVSGVDDTAAIAAILSTIGSNVGTIRLPYKHTSSQRCKVGNLTIPSNVTLDNSDGSGMAVISGQTLTVLGAVVAPPGRTTFFGPGTTSFTGNTVAGTSGQTLVSNGAGTASFNTVGLANTRLAKTATYALTNTDKGKTIALAGGAFYALTIAAASGFDADFMVMILNEDTVRAKRISPNGLTSFFLYPQQTAILYNQNNVWQVSRPVRWRIPASLTVYVDVTNGNDTNDGLAVGTGALATPQAAINLIKADFDLAGLRASPVIVQLADGTYAPPVVGAPIVLVSGAFTGQQMGTLVFPSADEVPVSIRGNDASPQNVILAGASVLGTVEAVWGAVIGIQGCKITNLNGGDISTGGGGGVQVGSGIYGASSGPKFQATHNSLIETYNNIQLDGNSSSVFDVDYFGSMYITNTVLLASNFTVTNFAHVARGSELTFAGATINLNGFGVTGRRFLIESNGSITTTGGADSAMTFLPGNSAGLANGNGSYDSLSGTTFTPTVTSTSGTITTVGTVTGRYFRPATNSHLLQIKLTITTNGTGAGYLKVSLPKAAAGFGYNLGARNDTTGVGLIAFVFDSDSTSVYISTQAGLYPGADATTITISGWYESTQ